MMNDESVEEQNKSFDEPLTNFYFTILIIIIKNIFIFRIIHHTSYYLNQFEK